jgi:uncharacterized protein with PQ loop repeat
MTVLATFATIYGVAGAFSSLLQARALMRAGSAREVSIPFIAILTGGHAIWLAYGIEIASWPLILTDAVGLGCGLVTCVTAARLIDRPRASGAAPFTRAPRPERS